MTELHITEDNIPHLDSKVTIATGGCAGIGLATAKILTSKGATVIIADLASPAETVENATWVKTDLSSWDSLKAAFKAADRVDIVVANAGILGDPNWLDDKLDEMGELMKPSTSVIDVNIVGVAMCAKLAVSYMRKKGSGGSIVLFASGIVYEPGAKVALYATSKFAVTGMLRGLRQSLINEDITINAVAPGVTSTQLVSSFKPAFVAKNEPMGTPPRGRSRHRVLCCCQGAVTQPHSLNGGRRVVFSVEEYLGGREGIPGDEGSGTNLPWDGRPRTALKVAVIGRWIM